MTIDDELARFAKMQDCTIDDLLEDLTEVDTDRQYDEWLDEAHEKIEICGLEYYPSAVFQAVDPIAYNCNYSDWLDECCSEIYYESPQGKYYWFSGVENLISELRDEQEETNNIDTNTNIETH